MAMATKVGALDIQFGQAYDMAKANQLVQSLQQTIAAVNALATQIATSPTPTTVPVHELAGESGLGPSHQVAGLTPGQVLVATSATTAEFAALSFGQLAGADAATFLAPAQGSIITLVNGYWTAASGSESALGLSPPGSDALLMWNNAIPGFAWAMGGPGIKVSAGEVSVLTGQLIHGQLQGLLADDHPQYALVGTVAELATQNVFEAQQVL